MPRWSLPTPTAGEVQELEKVTNTGYEKTTAQAAGVDTMLEA